MHAYLPHIASRVFGVPLLIQQRKLDVILRALGPRVGFGNRVDASAIDYYDPNQEDDGDPDDAAPGKPYIVTPDGIAIIGVDGSLVRKSSFINAVSGLTSYCDIENMFLDAATDSAVKGILLNVDSPGGEAGGVFDLSDQIFSQRGEKPIYAIANESMYSAAYALGSAADKLFVTRTGGVGSIGVICLHIDQSGMDKQEGLTYTAIYAGDHKNDFSPHEPITDAARSEMQDEVDRLYGMFVDTVARNRGLTAEAIRKTQAGLFNGPDAVSAGLADRVGNMAEALKALTAALPENQAKPQKVFSVAGTSVAANSNNREVSLVSEQTIVADPTPTTPQQPNPAVNTEAPQPATALTLPASLGSTYTSEDSLEVMELCALAGAPLSRATEFVSQRIPAAQVRKVLTSERAQASAVSPTVSTVLPQTSTQIDSRQNAKSPLMAAVDSLVERHKFIGGRS